MVSRAWTRWGDERLLSLRLSGLGIRGLGPFLDRCVERLYRELEAKGIAFRPHVWLSSDFFSPDGVPGIAVPFYLAHERLVRLERSQVLWAEGSSERECMRLLRHEAGHALDTAFHLHRKRAWRDAFGRRSAPYRRVYSADPTSRAFVRNLPRWYAQSHPAEDFAEAFAVWLAPRSGWRRRYDGWKALEKLELVDELMGQVENQEPAVRLRERTESIATLGELLAKHYAKKRRRWHGEPDAPYERPLSELFDLGKPMARRSSAAGFLIRSRAGVVRAAARRHGCDRYGTEQVLEGMAYRARELGLRLRTTGRGPTLSKLADVVHDTLRELHRGRYLLGR